MSEERKQDPSELARGVDPDGFFVIKIHTSQGLEKILGVLLTSMDMVKLLFVEQHKKEQSKIAKPNGFLQGFKNKWH